MTRALLTAATTCVLGGWTETPSPSPGADTFLSEVPRWTVEGSGFAPEHCFGNAFALGDVDGDGHKDLVAAAGPCGWDPTPLQGQVAIFRGNGTSFAREPVVSTMNWRNPSPRASGRNMTVALGNVDGDGYADILVRSTYGVLVFTGRQDLQEMFATPYSFTASGTFQGALFSDVNGDGLDDVLISRLGYFFTFLSTPAGPSRYTLVGYLPVGGLARAGDTNGDGAEDVLVSFASFSSNENTRLLLGCPQGQSCWAGVQQEPAWILPGAVLGMLPDQNGDGFSEVARGDIIGGRLSVHLSDPRTGQPADAPAWSVLGDPLYPGFGRGIVQLGDVNGDGKTTEFAVTAVGRVYIYFPEDGLSADLRPSWAWSGKEDALEARHTHVLSTRLPVVAADDLDGDGFAEVLVGAPPVPDAPSPGRILLYGGGHALPAQTGPRMPVPTQCGLAPDANGKPDLTVDEDLIGRSAFIEERFFDASSCEVQEQCVNAPGLRRLLRFSVSIPNLGNAPALIPGPTEAPELYYYDACHRHDHLLGFASYALHGAQDGVVATGRKQGYQLIDLQPYCMDAGRPTNHSPSMGMSPGWADIYTADLPCQWLDITDVPDGKYSLRVGVDLNDLVDEDDRLPNTADVTVHLQGNTVRVTPVGAFGP